MKVCRLCSRTLPLSEFGPHKATRDRLKHECYSCKREQSKTHYQANRDVRLAQTASWSASNPDKVRAAGKKYREGNTGKTRAKALEYYHSHKAQQRERNREWYRRNPDWERAKMAGRRSGIKASTPRWANRNAILAVYKLARGMRQMGLEVHVDHIVPLNHRLVCGLHVEHNLQVLSARDNSSKGNRHWPGMP